MAEFQIADKVDGKIVRRLVLFTILYLMLFDVVWCCLVLLDCLVD